MTRRNDWRFNDESLTTTTAGFRTGRALGRKKEPGAMNLTEKKFAQYLELRRQIGEVAWWCFEGMSFKIGERCYYTPDFPVMFSTCEMHIFDVKGTQRKQNKAGEVYETDYTEDDARVKLAACATLYPFPFSIAYLDGLGNWAFKQIGE
jgi:hypothetical protein